MVAQYSVPVMIILYSSSHCSYIDTQMRLYGHVRMWPLLRVVHLDDTATGCVHVPQPR